MLPSPCQRSPTLGDVVMKRVLQLLLVVLIAGVGALAWTFAPATLPDPAAAPLTPPPALTVAGVELKAILAGKMMSRAGMAYRGGSLTEERVFNMGGILVQHPKGPLLFATGFGSTVDEQCKMTPWLMQQTARYEKEPTVAAQLQSAGIAPAALTDIVLT